MLTGETAPLKTTEAGAQEDTKQVRICGAVRRIRSRWGLLQVRTMVEGTRGVQDTPSSSAPALASPTCSSTSQITKDICFLPPELVLPAYHKYVEDHEGLRRLRHLFWLQCARSYTLLLQCHTVLTERYPRYPHRRWGG